MNVDHKSIFMYLYLCFYIYIYIYIYRVFLWNRSVGFTKRSYPVKHEVLSSETEVLFRETLFH